MLLLLNHCFQRSAKIGSEQNTKLLFLIAQRLSVPFRNTNTFVQVYRWHACNFKEAAAASSQLMCQHKAASPREEECVWEERKRGREVGGSLAPVAGQMWWRPGVSPLSPLQEQRIWPAWPVANLQHTLFLYCSITHRVDPFFSCLFCTLAHHFPSLIFYLTASSHFYSLTNISSTHIFFLKSTLVSSCSQCLLGFSESHCTSWVRWVKWRKQGCSQRHLGCIQSPALGE